MYQGGTSIFAMVVLERPLSQVYPEIDMVTTPDGKPVAMVHCNNCTSEINAWAGMLQEFAHCIGSDLSDDRLYSLLYSKAAEGEKDGGGLLCATICRVSRSLTWRRDDLFWYAVRKAA